ncbi:MAG: hypothetical protein K0S32_2116 [Bacteroidetes bacterium]|jgi:hypothetical protein|nr:hypothetical protein [Bacteroidota bacterium]
MALDKVLNRIQLHIKELAPTLELFVDESVQPSVKDCENLQEQLVKLQECLAIYKYQKKEKEISPSFNIHAKVSEKEKTAPVVKAEEEKPKVDPVVSSMEEPVVKASPLAIGINDKFRFINELFKQNAPEYNIAIEQINALKTWADTESYLNSLKDLYEWKPNNEVVIYFYALVKKRFS